MQVILERAGMQMDADGRRWTQADGSRRGGNGRGEQRVAPGCAPLS